MIKREDVVKKLESLSRGEILLDQLDDWLADSDWNHGVSLEARQLVVSLQMAISAYDASFLNANELKERLLSLLNVDLPAIQMHVVPFRNVSFKSPADALHLVGASSVRSKMAFNDSNWKSVAPLNSMDLAFSLSA